MHSPLRVLAVFVCSLFTAGTPTVLAATPTDACAVLTTAQVSSALGSTVGEGTWISPEFKETCTWTIPTGGAVTFHLQTLQFFQAGQGALASGERASASGIGDEAYYLGLGSTVGLAVRKGNASFKVSVYSSDLTLDKRKAIEKALAQQALAKF
jgi:hypothetical protein